MVYGRRWLLIGLMAVLFVAAIASLLLIFVLRPIAAQGWQETPCEIIHSGVEKKWSDSGGRRRGGGYYVHRFEVAYTYTFEGTHYSGNRHNLDASWSSARAGADELAKRYRVGMRTTCYVNPKRPAEALLELWSDSRDPASWALVATRTLGAD